MRRVAASLSLPVTGSGEFSIVRQMTLNIYTAWQKADLAPAASDEPEGSCSSALRPSWALICLTGTCQGWGGGGVGLERVASAQTSAGSASALLQGNWERARSQMWVGGRNQRTEPAPGHFSPSQAVEVKAWQCLQPTAME